MPYLIAQPDCINCGKCRRECPTDTIRFFGQAEGKHWIDPAGCIDCDLCARVCPMDCITRQATPVVDVHLITEAREQARAFFRDRRSSAQNLGDYADTVLDELSVGGTHG